MKTSFSSIVAISNEIYDNSVFCNNNSIHLITKKDDLTLENVKKINPRYIFFPHWSYILPKEIYERYECVIFHMTDLPFGRGGSPLQNLIERKIYQTKISAIRCSEGIDAGDIYLKKKFSLAKGSAKQLYLKAAKVINKMIDEIIEKNPIPQKQIGEPVVFKRRTKDMSNLESLIDLESIFDYIRMLDCDGYPKAFLEIDTIRYEFSNVKRKNGKLTAKVEILKKNKGN